MAVDWKDFADSTAEVLCFHQRHNLYINIAFNQALTDSRSWAGQLKLFAYSPDSTLWRALCFKKKPIKQTEKKHQHANE